MEDIKLRLRDAVFRAGGYEAVSSKLRGTTRQAVYKWVASGRVPPKRAIALSEIIGIPAHELRPDVFIDRKPPVGGE